MPTPKRVFQRDEAANLVDRMGREMAQIYADAELRLQAKLADTIQKGYDQGQDVARLVRMGELRESIRAVATAVQAQAPEVAQRLVLEAAEKGALSAVAQIEKALGTSALTGAGQQLVAAPAVSAIAAELVLGATAATNAILTMEDSVLRRAVAMGTPDVLLGLSNTRVAQANIWRNVLKQGVTDFVDSSNRRWNLATYVEMATRTATRRAFTESHTHQMMEHGHNLVTVVVGRDSCRVCSSWAGKILSLDGSTGSVSMQHATNDDQLVRVDIAATLDEARSQGWQHPNCRCQVVAYFPGLSVPTDSTTYQPEREGERKRLRELEVQVRKAKLDELSAVTPEQKSEARARVRGLQGKIRDHTKDADIPRRRDREQINLGHKGNPPAPRSPKPGPKPPGPPPSPRVTLTGDKALLVPRKSAPLIQNSTLERLRAQEAAAVAARKAKTTQQTATVRPVAKKPPAPVSNAKIVAAKAANAELKAGNEALRAQLRAKEAALLAPKRPPARPSTKRVTTPKALDPVTGKAIKKPVAAPKLDKLPKMAPAQPFAKVKKEVNPNFGKDRSWMTNCSRTSATMELRRRGYDVTAAPRLKDDNTHANIASMWRENATGKPRDFQLTAAKRANVRMEEAGEGARFLVTTSWKNGGAHIWNAEVINGKVVHFEGQNIASKIDPNDYFDRSSGFVEYMRVDDMQPTDKLLESDWVRPRK